MNVSKKQIFTFALVLAAMLGITLAAAAQAPVRVNLTIPLGHIRDNAGNPVTESTPLDTLIRDAHAPMDPVLAPDGHELTLGEWLMARGWAGAKCVNKGTHVILRASGLIPYGVYTVWLFQIDADGMPVGRGALGPNDGSGNVMNANAHGEGTLTVIVPEGSLSISGAIGACLLEETEIHLLAAYHIDGKVSGPVPGLPSTWSGHLLAVFRRNSSHTAAVSSEGSSRNFLSAVQTPSEMMAWQCGGKLAANAPKYSPETKEADRGRGPSHDLPPDLRR